MKPYYHCKNSAKRYGGQPEDYAKVHDFIDGSKACMGDIRHRALLHSTFGCFMVEQVFGQTITNSEGRKVPVRALAEEHIIEDLGFLPTVEKWLGEIEIKDWMFGGKAGREQTALKKIIITANAKSHNEE